MANVNSRLIYDGRNTAGTDDIIVIVTGLDQKSINGKTKDMAQAQDVLFIVGCLPMTILFFCV